VDMARCAFIHLSYETNGGITNNGDYMNRLFYSLSLLFFLYPSLIGNSFADEAPPTDPIYIRIDNGWKGLYGHNDEYAEFSFKGKEVTLQDAHHILLKQHLGMMVTFADKKEFSQGANLLADHAQWEVNYWSKHASKVESSARNDLSDPGGSLKVTEIRVYNNEGIRMISYLIGLASKEGVFVLSISPVDKSVDPLVKEIVNSFKLVHRKLDIEEAKRVSLEVSSK
jgi:hypothetical protein